MISYVNFLLHSQGSPRSPQNFTGRADKNYNHLHAFAVVPIIKDPCPFARSHQQFEQAAHGDHTLLNNMLFALGTGRIRPRPGEQNASVGAGGSSSRNQLRQKEEEVLQSMVSFTCKEKLMKLVDPLKINTLQGVWFSFSCSGKAATELISRCVCMHRLHW